MIKNQWYAIEFGHLVGTTPKHVEIMGQQLVLWRNEDNKIVAQSDVCIHRGGSLSGGEVIDGCIRCPYHGWKFDQAGACVDIPANREGLPIPKKARIDTYPCEERYGYVFVFLGDLPEVERPPLAPISELEVLDVAPGAQKDGFRAITGEFRWAANYERVLENGVDIAHAPFVHRTSFGNPDKPEVEDYEVVDIASGGWSAGNISTVSLDPPPASGIWKYASKRNKERPPVKTRTGIFYPNVTMLEVNLKPLGVMRIFTAVVPVGPNRAISKWTMMRDFFTGSWADGNSRKRTDKIFLEDQATVEGQRPELVPFDLSAELHIKSDANQLAYRRWRQSCIDKGWDVETLKAGTENDYQEVRIIGSPARRENPELANAWVLKEYEAAEALRERRESAGTEGGVQ